MKKLFGFCLCSFLAVSVSARATLEAEPVNIITHKVEKEIYQLPTCNNADLLAKTKEYISAYFEKNTEGSAVFRRRRHFILHNIADFAKENISNYKTENSRPVSDIIIDVKINKGVAEENMLLCKNQSKYKAPSELYLLLHPENEGYRVYVINLKSPETALNEMSFFYK